MASVESIAASSLLRYPRARNPFIEIKHAGELHPILLTIPIIDTATFIPRFVPQNTVDRIRRNYDTMLGTELILPVVNDPNSPDYAKTISKAFIVWFNSFLMHTIIIGENLALHIGNGLMCSEQYLPLVISGSEVCCDGRIKGKVLISDAVYRTGFVDSKVAAFIRNTLFKHFAARAEVEITDTSNLILRCNPTATTLLDFKGMLLTLKENADNLFYQI